jgi:hypothetical protein
VNRIKLFLIAVCFSFGVSSAAPAIEVLTSPEATTMHYGDKVLWTYHHDSVEGKPYFHPLNTSSEDRLSELRPKGHPWHRGLWLSWKYINGVNYWEENPATGQSDGFTRLLKTERSIDDSQQVTIEQQLDYAPAPDGAALLLETRRLVIAPPDSSGNYHIDWSSEFHAAAAIELGRTPVLGEPNGKGYGGYAGLSIRLNKSSVGGTFLTGDGALDAEGIQNISAEWVSFSTEEGASILMMEHPESFRSPTKWYVAPMMPYYSPAILFDAPHSMAAGESLSLRYRIVISPKPIPAVKATAAFHDWTTPATQHRSCNN